MAAKYKIGDWAHSTRYGSFMKITQISGRVSWRCPDAGEYCYNVAFYMNEFAERGLKHVGDESGVPGTKIRPLTNPRDILLCLASDIQKKQHEASQEAKELAKDVGALMKSRELLGGLQNDK